MQVCNLGPAEIGSLFANSMNLTLSVVARSGGAAAAAARVDSHLGSPMDFRAGEPMTASPDFVPASGNRRSDYSSGSRKRRSVLDELDDECGYDDDDEEEDAMGNTLRQLSQEFEDIMR